ncbi:MAG: 50S ribosomal protein L10 [Conexivisphaerales archaeon]
MAVAKQYPIRKQNQFNKITSMFSKYDVIALASLTKVRSAQIMEMRKSMRGNLELLVAKNRITAKAIRALDKPNLDKFAENLHGQNLYIFTNMNPFKLNLLLEKSKVYLPAKAGDIATDTIIIPAGNTGIAPGPVLSEFKDCKVITKIEGGSIWVTKDTVVAEKGEIISPRLASLLSKLGVKPIKAGLSLNLVYWNGSVLTADKVTIDINEYLTNIKHCSQEAFNLSYQASYPASKEITSILVLESSNKALHLAIKAGYLTKDTVQSVIREAESKSTAIYGLLKQKGYN